MKPKATKYLYKNSNHTRCPANMTTVKQSGCTPTLGGGTSPCGETSSKGVAQTAHGGIIRIKHF